MHLEPRRDAVRLLKTIIAAAIFAFNIKTFVRGAGLFPGGFSGLTILIQSIFEKYLHIAIPYTLINVILNIAPTVIGIRFVGKKFTILTCVNVVLASVLVDVIPGVYLTDNVLLLTIFGGIVNGFAMSLCFSADATSGGTDIFSIYMSEHSNIDAFNFFLAANTAMLCVAGLLFGWERSLYSIIYQFTSTQVIHALFTRYQKQTLFIVTEKPEAVYNVIRETTHHGATLFKGEGLYQQAERSMVYSVVSREQVSEVTRRVRETDEHAFINSIRTQSIAGRFYQRPND